MKKKVLCFLALVMFLLLACTMLSTKIEQEMMTQVVVREVKPKPAGRSMVALPLWSLYNDDPNVDLEVMSVLREEESLELEKLHVYHVEPGVGWESGLRIREVEQGSYTVDVLNGFVSGFDEGKHWKFVTFASRSPEDGQQVEIVSPKKKAQDRYLVIYPDRVPGIRTTPQSMTISARTRNALLLEVEAAPQPFIRERAAKALGDLIEPGCEIYSVDTVEQFWKCLPALAAVGVILFAGVVLWVQSLFFLKRHRWMLLLNAILGTGLLWLLYRVLGGIDLPSDLLPAENIFQWSHYAQELSTVMSALAGTRGNFFESMMHLGRTGQGTVNLAFRVVRQAKDTLLIGTAIPLLWAVLPLVIRAIFPKREKTA